MFELKRVKSQNYKLTTQDHGAEKNVNNLHHFTLYEALIT